MRNYMFLFFGLSVFLASCGRHQLGYIKNETGEPIIVKLGLKDTTDNSSDYLRSRAEREIFSFERENVDTKFISYDTLLNELKVKLEINELLDLGTVRMDKTRDSLKYWEFNMIQAEGEGVNIFAEGVDILKLVQIENKLGYGNEYGLILK